MIKGNERTWISYFYGKKGKEGAIPKEAIEEHIRCYRIENTHGHSASYYRAMFTLDAPHWRHLPERDFRCLRSISTGMKILLLFLQTSPTWKIALIRSG